MRLILELDSDHKYELFNDAWEDPYWYKDQYNSIVWRTNSENLMGLFKAMWLFMNEVVLDRGLR